MRRIVGVFAVLVLALGLDLWASLAATGTVAFRLMPFTSAFNLHPALAVALGVLIGLSAAIALVSFVPRVDPVHPPAVQQAPAALRDRLVFASGMTVAVTAGALLIVAVADNRIPVVVAALAFVLGWLAVLATVQAVRAMARGEGIAFDSYWGGLGGAQGGWRVSPATTLLVLSLVLVAATVAVATGHGPTAPGPASASSAGAGNAEGVGKGAGNGGARSPGQRGRAGAVERRAG